MDYLYKNNIKEKNEIYLNELKDYIKYISSNEQNLNFISKQILFKFLGEEKKIFDRNNKLKQLIMKKEKNTSNSPSLKYLLLFKKFSKWKRLLKNNRNQDKINQTFDNRSITKEELEELKECTFHPKINSNYYSSRNSKKNTLKENEEEKNSKVYERLYNVFLKYNLNREVKKNESEQLNQNSFSPKLNRTPKKYNKISNQSFTERLKFFEDKKNEKLKNIGENIKKEEVKRYTFQPILNDNRRKVNIEEMKKREKEKKQKEENEDRPKSIKRNVDKQRIENLFLSYKEKQNKIEKIKKEMEKDEGITFKPYIETENSVLAKKYNKKLGDDDFFKRKTKFETLQTQRSKENRKKYSPQRPKKRVYTSKEKEIITQNIINRLYGEGLQEHLLKNNMKEKSQQEDK